MSILILNLAYPATGAAAEYDYAVSTDGQALSAQGRAPLALLPVPPARGSSVVVVVPGRALSWHQVTLPGNIHRALRGRRADQPRLRAVLVGLLEESLLDEPEQLHFAVFPGAARDAPVWVAVCQRAWLLEALRPLQTLAQPISRIVPEFTPLLGSETPATADVTADLAPAQLVLCTAQGVTLLPLGDTAAALVLQAQPVVIHAQPAVAALAERAFGRPVQVRTQGERQLQALRSTWNLAQFELSVSRRSRALKTLALGASQLVSASHWRPLRWGLVLLLLVQVIGLNALAWKERALLADKRQALQQRLTQSFPDTTVIVDAPLQMERAVARLQEAAGFSGTPGLVEVLVAVAEAAPAYPPPMVIELDAGEFRLQGPPLAAEAVANLTRRLAAQGWDARMQGEQLVLQQERP